LIYPKGGYILHMIRMMMWDPKTGDHNFQEAMKDYVRTFQNRPASTEDFKAVLERHMLPVMNATSDGKLDWFFNEYVYGTALPAYKFDFKIENSTSGSPALKMSCEQSNVDENFRMPVPVYLEWADGRVSRLGSLLMVGNSKKDFEVSLNGVKQLPRRALLNYFADVLAAK
jgi:aminopeptidase N